MEKNNGIIITISEEQLRHLLKMVVINCGTTITSMIQNAWSNELRIAPNNAKNYVPSWGVEFSNGMAGCQIANLQQPYNPNPSFAPIVQQGVLNAFVERELGANNSDYKLTMSGELLYGAINEALLEMLPNSNIKLITEPAAKNDIKISVDDPMSESFNK